MSLTLYVVFLVGLAAAQPTVDNCPPNIPRNVYLEVYKDICYQFVVVKAGEKDYLHARQDCRARGGILALAKTQDIQTYLLRKLTGYAVGDSVWIGLNDIVKENVFVWEDGTHLDPTQSTWADGSGPREGILEHRLGDCVAIDMARKGLWVDYYCQNELFGLLDRNKKYICQFNFVPATTAGPHKITINTIIG